MIPDACFERDAAIPRMMKLGKLFTDGLQAGAERHGLQVRISGPPSLPFMKFSNETNLLRQQRFFDSERCQHGRNRIGKRAFHIQRGDA